MVTLIFLRGLCGYVWVNIFTWSPAEGSNIRMDFCSCSAHCFGKKLHSVSLDPLGEIKWEYQLIHTHKNPWGLFHSRLQKFQWKRHFSLVLIRSFWNFTGETRYIVWPYNKARNSNWFWGQLDCSILAILLKQKVLKYVIMHSLWQLS